MQKLTAILVLAVLQVATCQNRNQRAVLYEQNSQSGEYIVIPQTYVSDLSDYNFDNKAASFCVTGIWLFYVETSYNQGQNTGMEYVFGPQEFCGNFRTVGRAISSARFAGSPTDYSADTMTVFENTFFQGEEEYTFVDLPSLSLAGNHASLIITGASPWTVYDGPNYQGNAVCLYPPTSNDYTPYFLTDTTSISIPYGTIKSLRIGCWGKKVSELTRFG